MDDKTQPVLNLPGHNVNATSLTSIRTGLRVSQAILQAIYARATILRLPEALGPRSDVHAAKQNFGSPLRLLLVGESSAMGVGVRSVSHSLIAYLAAELSRTLSRSVHWKLIGKTGSTLRALVGQLQSCALEQFDLAIVIAGVNDVFRLTTTKRWIEEVRALTDILHEHGSSFVLFSHIPPVGDFPAFRPPLAALLTKRAQTLNFALERAIATHPACGTCPWEIPNKPSMFARDKVHPSAIGYRTWAEVLAARVLQLEHIRQTGATKK